MSSFWDEYGLLHVQPDVPSENGILFASHYWALEKVHGHHIYNGDVAIESTTMYKDWFVANPPEKGTHFSHDNMTGLKCLMYNIYGTELGTPILRWNDRFWLHPRDIIFYLALRLEGLFGTILALSLLPFLLFSLMSKRQVTSGKCLWFLRLSTLSMSNTTGLSFVGSTYLIISTFILSARHGNEPWYDIFCVYFKNPNHPLRDKVLELYDE